MLSTPSLLTLIPFYTIKILFQVCIINKKIIQPNVYNRKTSFKNVTPKIEPKNVFDSRVFALRDDCQELAS